MKTFKQFIQEATTPTLEGFVTAHCKPLLAELGTDFNGLAQIPLYRGMSSKNSKSIQLLIDGKPRTCLIKQVRQDRQPLDTHPAISKLLDSYFQQEFGWKPRSQALFCYGKSGRSLTEEYGKLHQIYPIGDFKFLYGDVSDLTTLVSRVLRDNKIKRITDAAESYHEDQLNTIKQKLFDQLADLYVDSDLKAGLAGRIRELMIGCQSYLAVPVRLGNL